MSVSWSDVIYFIRCYGQILYVAMESTIYWSRDYIADMVKQAKEKKSWYQLLTQIDLIYHLCFYVL